MSLTCPAPHCDQEMPAGRWDWSCPRCGWWVERTGIEETQEADR